MVAAEAIPRRGFTAKFIESLKPREKLYELADPITPGLVLRIHPAPSSLKSFRWYVRSLGRVITIGPWSLEERPAYVTLSGARGWLEQLKAARKAGPGQLDAVEARLREHLRPPRLLSPSEARGDTVAGLADDFLALLDQQRKRPLDARRVFTKDILPIIGHIPLASLKKADCRAVVAKVIARGATVYAGHVLGLLKQCLRYGANVREDFVSPVSDLQGAYLGIEHHVRQRALDDKEIVTFWRALKPPKATAKPTKRSIPEPRTVLALKILLLTAVRGQELRLGRWEHVDLEKATWLVPVESQKLTKRAAQKAKPIIVPLSPMVVGLFKELQALGEADRVKLKAEEVSPWVLASPEAHNGRYTDKALSKAMRRLWLTHPELAKLPPATPHDLRRTCRTHLGRLGVAPHVAERVLAHAVGTIEKTYDVGSYLAERRDALERWALFVDRLLHPEQSNVVQLPVAATP